MKRNYKPILLGVVLAASGLITACEKQEIEQPRKSGLLTQKSGLSAKQKSKVNNYRKAAKILVDLLKEDNSFVQKVKEGMKLSRPGQENVTFKELLDKASKAKEIAAGATVFEKKFRDIDKIHKSQNNEPDATAAEDLLSALIADGAQVYFPYSEKFPGVLDKFTVSFDPIDNADISTGYQYDPASGKMKEVKVDDDYAYTHPTLIVMEDDAVSSLYIPDDPYDPSEPEPDPYDPSDPGDSPVTTPPRHSYAVGDTVTEIYVGGVRLKENKDGLFDGNNEVRFVRSDTFISLNATGQVVSGTNGYIVKNADVSRVNARDKNWVYKNIFFDSDWIRTKTSQHIAVYEHDPHKTKTLKTTTGLSIPVPGVGTVNQAVENTLTYSTDHELWGNQTYYRQSFLNTNTIPSWGGTLKDGFRLYTDGPIEFNLPHRTLIFNP